MVEKIKDTMDRCYVIKTKELVAIITLVLLLVGAYNSVLASVDSRYATKETVITLGERVERVDGKIQRLLDHFSIKGIEEGQR
jgi:hypothetical protein